MSVPTLYDDATIERICEGYGRSVPQICGLVGSPAIAMTAQPALPAEPDRGGRPTLYRPEYCQEVQDFCADGLSLKAFAGKIGVARRTLTLWRETHPEFDDACEIAKAKACLWYEAQLRSVAKGEGGPGAATAAMFAVKNFGAEDFNDRRQLEHIGGVDHRHLTYDQALEEARRRGLPMRVLEEAGYLTGPAEDAEYSEAAE